MVKSAFALPIGFGIAIILAQIHLLRLIVNSTYSLIFSSEAWWQRLVLIFVALGLFGAVYYLSGYLSKYLKKAKEAKEKAEVRQAGKEIKAVARGLEE
jgi:predicted Na+-dependent transporter